MGLTDPLKKWKRSFDNYLTYRRILLFSFMVFCFLVYVSPDLLKFTSEEGESTEDILNRCIEDSLLYYHQDKHFSNVDFRYEPKNENEKSFLPFIGNGFLGIPITREASLYLKGAKILSFDTRWNPIISVLTAVPLKEVYISNFLTGTVNRQQCFTNGLSVFYSYFAHRVFSNLFFQELKILNPSNKVIRVHLNNPTIPTWATASKKYMRSFGGDIGNEVYNYYNGRVESRSENLAVAILIKTWPSYIEILPHQTTFVTVPCIIHYEKFNGEDMFINEQVENKLMEVFKNITKYRFLQIQQEHINSWHHLWRSGLSISHSKAAGALNGDSINATMYYVLSNVQFYKNDSSLQNFNINHYIAEAEGCYGGYHHTLQAKNLWNSLSTMKEVNESVYLWLLTLEKQGCHKLNRGGAEYILQAMILSFGGFRFSAHHLEFKMDPKFLHRDYFFRRIRYNHKTFINVSVTLQEDNKAIIGVSLDGYDRNYYACDGGCIDLPVHLSSQVSYFPVKITDPITSILYITSDKEHIELIKDTLHVQKIVEAPAHDHQVIALHRHGHHLGGLPLMFWASVCFLIVIFHLFLFKLIFNEYCGKQEKFKVRYARI